MRTIRRPVTIIIVVVVIAECGFCVWKPIQKQHIMLVLPWSICILFIPQQYIVPYAKQY